MSEANTWKRMREGILGVEPMADLSRVENMVEAGMPDVNFCLGIGVEGWIELKHRGEMPDREGTPVFSNCGLRDAQIVWIHKRVKRGGRVFIYAQVDDMLFLVHGCWARVFNTWTMTELYAHARFRHIGKSPPWLELVRCLTEEYAHG